VLGRHFDIGDDGELATLLLDRRGLAILPGSAFGDDPTALRLRFATSLLYGDDDEQRLAALNADDPLQLPWIVDGLKRLGHALAR
jgi:aspartate aminotransferase